MIGLQTDDATHDDLEREEMLAMAEELDHHLDQVTY